MILERLLEPVILWAEVYGPWVLVVVAILVACASIWFYVLSLEARTNTVYRNPDFPCVTAINPTVTDSDCEAAIARRP